ncbi:MAG: hypothetical protein LBQ62_03030, partial [Candidatus Accumulibacter sp.]|nr:hypothetical protein [Accumulibacter sp.]
LPFQYSKRETYYNMFHTFKNVCRNLGIIISRCSFPTPFFIMIEASIAVHRAFRRFAVPLAGPVHHF